jgi:hypothetical protein
MLAERARKFPTKTFPSSKPPATRPAPTAGTHLEFNSVEVKGCAQPGNERVAKFAEELTCLVFFALLIEPVKKIFQLRLLLGR